MEDKTRILLVEDDVIQREGLVESLSQVEDFNVDAVATGEEALDLVSSWEPEVVILDVHLLGELDGFQTARTIIQQGNSCSIIMLTIHDEDDKRAEGLDAGAVTYLGKPVLFRVLLAQIRSVLTASRIQRQHELRLGEFTLLPLRKLLVGRSSKTGEPVEMALSELQVEVLQFLHSHAGEYVPVKMLLKEVWRYSATTETHTVETTIHKIRNTLNNHGFRKDLIITKAGRGYRLAMAPSDLQTADQGGMSGAVGNPGR